MKDIKNWDTNDESDDYDKSLQVSSLASTLKIV